MKSSVLHGDCREVMASMDAESVDSIVTDPPYGLSFMGKGWDKGVPGVEFWVEALRVAKPGAHLLAFGGTRMVHRLAVAIEDAGWEIRDRVHWVYGSGFPKSHDVSKAIDKAAGVERRFLGYKPSDRPNRVKRQGASMSGAETRAVDTAPATPEAQQWHGWGTALKPAVEPIILARKPFKGTVAANVLEHGTGAINVDGCRVSHNEACRTMAPSRANMDSPSEKCRQAGRRKETLELKPSGRWPANLIHDGSDEVLGHFPVATSGSRKAGRHTIAGGQGRYGEFTEGDMPEIKGSSGSAARFFYCAKASKKDRGEDNNHPTVKPTELMAYLCRLITPPNGTVLDPFCGSGSTGKAAVREGFGFVGIEQDEAYAEIARQRVKAG